MPPQFVDLPQGTVDLLILRTLALQPVGRLRMHPADFERRA